MPDKLFAYNFRRLRKLKRWTKEETAERGGVSASYVNGIETAHKYFGRNAQIKWAAVFGVDYLEFHKPIDGEEGAPVIAYVSAGGGVIPMSADDYPAGYGFEVVERPPGCTQEQVEQQGIYAVKIQGDSMYPALRNGWYLYIRPEPSKALRADDLVIVKDDTGTAWVKEIESINQEEIVLHSIGKGPTITKRIDQIAVIERVFFIKP